MPATGEALPGPKLADAVAARADTLAAAGLTARNRVMIAHPSSIDFVIDLLAVWHLEASAAPVPPALTAPERDSLIARYQPQVILAETGDIWRQGAPAGPGEALVLFTSGTTGTPKGVVLTGAALAARIAANHAAIPEAERRVALALLPPSFGHGLIGGMLTPLLGGGDLVLWPSPGIIGLPRLPEIIAHHGVRFLTSVPAFWALVRRLDLPRPAPLARVHIGSAPLDAALLSWVRDWSGGAEIRDMYGLTECANWVGGGARAGRYTLWDGEAAVLTPDGPAAEGAGEVLLRGPSLMQGYLDQPEATAAAFYGDWFRTGDLGQIAGGEITLTGRLKTQINRGGMKISPEAVERAALACPGVTGALAFGYPDPMLGEGLALALTGPVEGLIDRAKSTMRAHLMADHLPDRWFQLEALPLTDRGKPDRAAARQLTIGA
ncbi:MAG: class I adenylate-forming enzyme family protein [Pseudomonadota bacterium]